MRKPKFFLVECVCKKPVQVIYSSSIKSIMKYVEDLILKSFYNDKKRTEVIYNKLYTEKYYDDDYGWSLTILEAENNS